MVVKFNSLGLRVSLEVEMSGRVKTEREKLYVKPKQR
jgi:hypothetical protein